MLGMAYAIMNLVRPLFALFIYLVLCLTAAPAQSPPPRYAKYVGKEVVNVQFVPAQQPVDPSELHEILPLKIGAPLAVETVRASIERLFATGRYRDIEVDVEAYGTGVIVRFLTQNSWFIGNVALVGDAPDPPNAGQLENATRLDLGQPYTVAKLREALEGETRLLENHGFYRSRIHPLFEYDTTYQQVHIKFEIDSGPRAKFVTPVLQGDLKMPSEKIVSATGWRRWVIRTWRPVSQAKLAQGVEGVRNLYQKDNRLEAKVTVESLRYDPERNAAVPTLQIQPGPQIQIRTFGAKVSRRKLKRYVPVYEEHAVDNDLLLEGARNLRNYFQSAGYYDAEVEVKPQRVTNDKADIDYLVNTGKRHKLVAISVSGNKYFNTKAIRERMFLQPSSLLQFPHGRYSEMLLRRDEESISELYRSNGFRDVAVSHRVEDAYRGKVGDIAVFLEIREGPQYFVGSLTVEGITRLDQAEILATLSSAEGQPFSESSVAVDRDTILARYFEAGFPNATFEWSTRPAPAPYRVELRFVVAEGRQQYVREVLISGLKTTRPGIVHRNIALNPGDPLSPVAMTDTQRRLYDLGVFARVDTAIQNPDGESDRKYVLYEMNEARRYSLAVGIGAEVARIGGCQTCLDASSTPAGFSPRVSLDVARTNLWGLAHTLSLRTRVSTLDDRVLLNYSWPRFRNLERFTLSFTGLYEDSRDVRTFSYVRQEGSVQFSQRYSKATTFLYRYTYRRVNVDENTLKIAPLLIPLLSQPVRLGSLSGSMIFDHRDDPLDPRKGIYNTIDLGLADRVFGSQRNFLRFLGRNASYHQIGRSLVLARSTQFGVIYSFNFKGNAADAVPLSERFFGGGGTSHRGFPENQAGPRDTSTGFPLGGSAQLFNQTELRFPLLGDNVGGVLFHDLGNTFSSLGKMSLRMSQHDLRDFDYTAHAVGFGVRYRTPIGPVRVDLGYSVNPPSFYGFKGTQAELVQAGLTPCSPPPGRPNRCVVQNVNHFQFFFSIGQTF